LTLVTAGRVGKPHGRDGSFYVEGAAHALPVGHEVLLADRRHSVARRAGTDARPLIRLSGLDDPGPLRGELLLVEEKLGEGEWLASDLVGCSVPGHGHVVRVLDGPSCSVLELSDGLLVPFVSDAIRSVRRGGIPAPPGEATAPPGEAAAPPGEATAPPGEATAPPGEAAAPPGEILINEEFLG
jgi:16S rRNA processing protein RimM